MPRGDIVGYRGVRRIGTKFRAVVYVNGKARQLGTFDHPRQAHRAVEDFYKINGSTE